MYCRHCGKQIDDNSQFCDYCGVPVKKAGKKNPARIILPVCAGILAAAGIVVAICFIAKGRSPKKPEQSVKENSETFPRSAYDSWLNENPEISSGMIPPAETENSSAQSESSAPIPEPSQDSDGLPTETAKPEMSEPPEQTEAPLGERPASQPETVPETQAPDSPVISGYDSSFWGQNFYGFIQLTNGTGQFSGHDGKEDFLMLSECEGSSGRFRLVSESCKENRIVGECRFDLTDGVTSRGMLKSNYVLFNGQEDGYWEADPGTGFSQPFGDMITIGGKFINDSGSFDYTFFLKPWGSRWEDVQTAYPDLMPRHYSDWYLPKIEAGEQAPSYFH